MQIKKDTVVSLTYKMFDSDGEMLDESQEPLVYLHGGYDGIFPLVEEALQDKTVGDSIDVAMESELAFGDRDESLIREEDLGDFPADITIGMMFEADDEETGDVMVFTVADIADGKVTLDGNHPLAGLDLRFVATVEDVRAATKDEMEHGHAHDPHGHHHH